MQLFYSLVFICIAVIMANIHSSHVIKKCELISSGDEPTIYIESEGDRLIQNLSAKQLDTNLTLELQKRQEKLFERGTGYVPLSAHSSGSSTLHELKRKVSQNERLEELSVLGLTPQEAQAVLSGADLTFPQSKVETSIKEARAKQIKDLLDKRANRVLAQYETNERDFINRHERELALAVKPDSTETKLLQFVLSCKQESVRDDRPLDHPIHHLNDLEQALFGQHNPRQLANTVMRKRRQILDASLPPCGPKFMKRQEKGRNNSLWDQEVESVKKPLVNRKCPVACKNRSKKLYTIKNGEIVEVNVKTQSSDIESSSKDITISDSNGHQLVNILSHSRTDGKDTLPLPPSGQLSVEEIKSIPKFKDYLIGVRSKVLYIKNLSKTVKEDDLVALFSRFQRPHEPSISYRLMSGKMHGQAFVTFPNDRTAEEALESTNGRVVNGKPIVIQYGKL